MAGDNEKPQAQIHKLREGAGAAHALHLAETYAADLNRRADDIGIVYWTRAASMPLDLFSLIREARVCYTNAQYLGAITLSAAAVELIVNKDGRTKDLILSRMGGWATLNNRNLRLVQMVGLPVHVLLSAGESVGAGQPPITFVHRRDKVAHGDFSSFVTTLSDYDPGAEADARDEALKARDFVVEWFNTAPDVQDGHIQHSQWPA
jgi:hypothetical protein